jgi:hypothetical protein
LNQADRETLLFRAPTLSALPPSTSRTQRIPRARHSFRFELGDLDFNAVNFEYLVISGAKAQFKGFVKLNGSGAYNFLLAVMAAGLIVSG